MYTALEFDSVSHLYKDDWTRKTIEALKPLSLKIEEGECFGFLGHNGAGKTTTIKCLLGLIATYSGSIKIFGKNAQHSVNRRGIGFVPEQPYFYDYLTVAELLRYYGKLSGINSTELSAATKEVLSRLMISDLESKKMRGLSKGLTQKVALAQALLHRPKLLILDEPFSGLDPVGRKVVRDVIAEEKARGTTIFMSTHILSDVELLCDRASILSKGQLKGVVKLGQVSAPTRWQVKWKGNGKEEVSECFSQSELQSLISAIINKNGALLSVEPVAKSLEEQFVELIGER